MKSTLTIIIMAFAAILMSCESSNSDSEVQIGTEKNIYDIEIKNNEKWVVVEEMMAHIQRMDEDIKTTGNAETPNLDGLGEKLMDNIDLLTSNCTMTGKGHDELHKWLIPFIDLADELTKAESRDEQETIFQSLQESMEEFNAYFE